jgi:peptidoglycan biosynthesis protein MviN/MurJ (putative lipid II flippase)
LGTPIVRLIFEHRAFTPEDTRQTWLALAYYLPGLPFVAIDLPLVFASTPKRTR